jgi:hypothetical protein
MSDGPVIPEHFIPGYLYRGQRASSAVASSSELSNLTALWVDEMLPSCISLVVELWSSEFDLTLRSAIDADGNDLTQKVDSIATKMLADSIGTDIDDWLAKVNPWPVDIAHMRVAPTYNRLWIWTRAEGVRPIGPSLDFIWRD